MKFTPKVVFETVKLVNKLGFTPQKVASLFDEETDKELLGQELFESVLALPGVEDDFYDLLVMITGQTREEVELLDFDEIEEAFKKLFSTSKRLDFLKRAFKSQQLTSVSEDTE